MTDKPQVWIKAGDGLQVGIPEGGEMMDSEGRFAWEPYGFTLFTWRPRRCRNGKIRWLCFVERHEDGTYTKGRLS